MASGPLILVDETDNELRCLARPRALLATLSIAGVILALLASLGLPLLSTVASQLRRSTVRLEPEMFFAVVWLVVFAGLWVVIIIAIRRQQARNGIVIEGDVVYVFTPEQTKGSYRFPRSELGGADLSRSPRQLRVTGLTIRRRRGWAINLLIGYPVAELMVVMDAVNRKVLEDRASAFQVLMDPPAEKP